MLLGLPGLASAQAEPFVGQIMCAGFNFAPRGWAELNGQLMPIAQNTALLSLLGTQHGGDGRTNFALPDMRGRVLLHAGKNFPAGANAAVPVMPPYLTVKCFMAMEGIYPSRP